MTSIEWNSFDTLATWYTNGGYKTSPWLELLDLNKWIKPSQQQTATIDSVDDTDNDDVDMQQQQQQQQHQHAGLNDTEREQAIYDFNDNDDDNDENVDDDDNDYGQQIYVTE